MATKCPNCNRRLTLLDWKQSCPDCGTNLMFHGFEERFYEDAKRSELGRARVRVWWAKVLACFFGGKLQIARLILVLLPVAASVVPLCTLHIRLPLYTSDLSMGLIGLISAFSDGTLSAVTGLTDAPVIGTVVAALFGVGIGLGGALLSAVLLVLCELLCFLGAKVMSAILCAVSVLGAGFAVYGAVAAQGLSEAAAGFSSVFDFSAGFGSYLLLAAFLAVGGVNLTLFFKGVCVTYKPGDLYRVDVAKKIKQKKLTLAALPVPVFETPEEKEERERLILDTMNGVSPENDKAKEGATV